MPEPVASPRARTLLVIALLCLALWCSAYAVLEFTVSPALKHYRQKLAATHIDRVEQAVAGQMDLLQLINRDYSLWDDMHQYVLDPASMPGFIKEQMYEDYWWLMGVELIIILDRSGEFTWGLLTDVGGKQKFSVQEVALPLFANNPLFTSPAGISSATRGLINTPLGLMMIVSAPIMHNDGSGPVAGSLIMGRTFSNDNLSAIGRAAGARVSVSLLADSTITDTLRNVPAELKAREMGFLALGEGKRLTLLSQLRDLYGDPVAILETESNSSGSSVGTDAIRAALKYLALAIVACALLGWLLLRLARTSKQPARSR